MDRANIYYLIIIVLFVFQTEEKADNLPWCTDPDWKDILEQVGYTLPERYLPLLKYGTRIQFLQLGLYSYWRLDAYGVQNEGLTYGRGYLSHERVDFQRYLFFQDCVHLNRRGAEWLTKRLACDIDSLARKRELKIKITK